MEQFENLVDLLERSVEKFADRPRLGTKGPDGNWHYITFAEFKELVDACRGGLAGLGIGKGDRVAVISNNRVEWAVGAYACYGLGAVYVAMYEKQNPDDWAHILRDCGAKVLLVANETVEAKVRPIAAEIDHLEHIVNFEAPSGADGSWKDLLDAGRANPAPAIRPNRDDLATLIYTSGTTGKPKGVMLTHYNIASNVSAIMAIFPMEPGDVSVAFLPWAHSFGQTCELHTLTAYGAASAIAEGVDKLVQNFAEVKPTLMFAVPRIFNRIYDGLNKRIAGAPPLKRKLFAAAMANASRRRELEEQGRRSFLVDLKHKFFDRLVFSKVRAGLGGRLKYAFSGGAALSKEVAQFIDNIGIMVYEGYGLSETSPVATANYPGNRKIGSVGKPIPGVEILIDTDVVDGAFGDEGEVLIKGPNIMKGYWNMPEETKKVIREDGAFRTGDMGRLDSDGYLYITGRIKEQYKLENGKYVVPAPLEEQLKLSGYINQIMVYGANRPYNVALIVPDVEALKKWAEREGLPGDLQALLAHPRTRELYRDELDRYSSGFKGYERIRDFRLIPEEFTTDNDMLTPTLKLKRRNVIKTYQNLLDEMYSGRAAA